jgi:hypothetical protein
MAYPDAFHEVAKKVNNWGRWGADDERGTLNFITPEVVKRAADGAVIALHDVAVTDAAFGVGRLFEELDGSRFGKVLIGAWPGLGLVQVRKAG